MQGLGGLSVAVIGRLVIRELRAMRAQMVRQNELLARAVDKFAPALPITNQAEVAATTGVDYLDPTESALVLDFIAKTEDTTGHRPTEEEILTYLADEKTIDLHTRLKVREVEVDRLLQSRRERL